MSALDKAVGDFFASLESPHSRRGYAHDWSLFADWLKHRRVKALAAKPGDVQRYTTHLRDEGKARPTRGRALSVIRAVYDRLVVEGLVEYNPARAVKNPRSDSRPKTPWLDEEALSRLTRSLGDRSGDWRRRRNRLCVLLFIGIGWRRAEIARLRVENFSADFSTVTGTVKRGKRATVRVPEWLCEEISAWVADATSGPLLPRALGSSHSISDNLAYLIVKCAALAAGFPPSAVTPHALRRTLVTLSGKRGVSLKDRQRALAHETTRTTERYDHDPGGAVAPGDSLRDLVVEEKK